MKINKRKQRGATLITWMIVAGFGILSASAVIKVAPYYMEFQNVKKMMNSIAASPNVKSANLRQINSKIEKYLDVNSLYSLEKSYYASKRNRTVTNPFTIVRLKKGNNRKKLTVKYDVPQPWIGNLSFLINFKYSVVLGEPKK